MYVRIARFDDVGPAALDSQAALIRGQIEASRSGELPADAPEQIRTLTETVTRTLYLGDRENGRALGIVMCASEEDMRRADAALNEMSPGEGAGSRTGVEIYEVLVDEQLA